jgi:hypothetical protein
VGQFERGRNEFSRKGAKAQRKTGCFLCAFAPLRESLSSVVADLNFKLTHYQKVKGKSEEG